VKSKKRRHNLEKREAPREAPMVALHQGRRKKRRRAFSRRQGEKEGANSTPDPGLAEGWLSQIKEKNHTREGEKKTGAKEKGRKSLKKEGKTENWGAQGNIGNPWRKLRRNALRN